MKCARNGGATAPAAGGRIIDFEFALAAATAISVRAESIGVPVVQRPLPWASAAAVSSAPAASSMAVKVLNLAIFVSSRPWQTEGETFFQQHCAGRAGH